MRLLIIGGWSETTPSNYWGYSGTTPSNYGGVTLKLFLQISGCDFWKTLDPSLKCLLKFIEMQVSVKNLLGG